MSILNLYQADPSLDLEIIGTSYPADVCGNKFGANYCQNDGANQVIDVSFDKNASHLLVSRLGGKITVFDVDRDLVFTNERVVANINVDSGSAREFGLTGVIVAQNYIIAAVTTVDGDEGVASLIRFDVDSDFKVITRTTIREWRDPILKANAHNLHGGVMLMGYEDVFVVSFGDLNRAKFCNDPSVDYGKILIMDKDGNAPDQGVFRTGYSNNMHLAYGNRNMFSMAQLPASIDTSQRFVWGENGNALQRACVYSLAAQETRHNLQWATGQDTNDWIQMTDPVTGSDAVLFVGPDTSGVVVSTFQGNEQLMTSKKYLPPMNRGTVYLLHSYIQNKPDSDRNRAIFLEYIANLGTAPQPAGFTILKKLVWTSNPYASAPMATAIHPVTGDFVFGDVFSGNVVLARFIKPIDGIDLSVSPTINTVQLQEWSPLVITILVLCGALIIFLIVCLIVVCLRMKSRKIEFEKHIKKN